MWRWLWALLVVSGGVAALLTASARVDADLPESPALGAPTATPTCAPMMIRTATPPVPTSPTVTPSATPWCSVYYADPYGPGGNGYTFTNQTRPDWRKDCDHDGVSSILDVSCVQPLGTYPPSGAATRTPTPTLPNGCYAFSGGFPVGTCTPGAGGGGPTETPTPEGTSTYTRTATVTATPTEVLVTEVQAEQLIAQSADEVRLLFIASVLLVGVLVALTLAFIRR